jgi:hypothetical protein
MCGAQLRNKPGTSCRQTAGKNTPHEGNGRCWLHGGLTPVKSGRWSKVTRRAISELVEQMAQDDNPLDILPDLFMVRALLVDFLNRYKENSEAVLAWHASWNGRPWRTEDLVKITDVLNEFEGRLREAGEWEESTIALQCEQVQAMVANMKESYSGKPREILDISDAHRMAVEASKMVERIEKIRARNAVSQQDFARVMTEIGRSAETSLSPSRLRAALQAAGVLTADMTEEQMVRAADELRNTLSDSWMSIQIF